MQWNSDEVGEQVGFENQKIMAAFSDRNASKTLQ
jgi:hypothetical protein